MPRREFWLVLGHLFVVALALGDDEVAASLGEAFGWTAGFVGAVETAITVGVLFLWGALTLAWVQARRGG
jgi:hypothetical protein